MAKTWNDSYKTGFNDAIDMVLQQAEALGMSIGADR